MKVNLIATNVKTQNKEGKEYQYISVGVYREDGKYTELGRVFIDDAKKDLLDLYGIKPQEPIISLV